VARGLWKGAISFGLVNVPVELHSTKRRSSELDMTMLDKRDLAPVGYKRVNKSTGKEVPWTEW
jgi:DNA end-binding protein Ku